MWELLAPQKSLPELYSGTRFHLVFIYNCSLQEKQVIKDRMGLGGNICGMHVFGTCFNRGEQGTLSLSFMCMIVLCLLCLYIHSFIHPTIYLIIYSLYNYVYICLCMCVCAHVDVHVHMCAYVCQKLTLDASFNCSLPYYFTKVLSLNLELTDTPR